MADDNTKLIIVLEAQSKKLQNSLVDVNRQIDKFAQATERRFAQMQQKSNASFAKLSSELKGSVGGIQNLLGPLLGALGTREIIGYSDAWQQAGNKIAAAGSVAKLLPRSLEELKSSANGARTALSEYVDLYSRLLRVAPGVQASELQIAKATDIVAKSLKAGGASAQEQEASLIQLGQALGSGFLQGDELRSLRENAPLLARAIANEFGTTIGGLKALGAAGELDIKRVFKGILDGGADIEKAFKATKSTIGEAFTRIDNEFTQFIGTAGRAGGATQGLIDALNYLADNFQEVGDAVLTFVAVVTTALIGKAVVGMVVGFSEAVLALGTLLAAMASGTVTAAIFTAALGPIAIIAAAAALAIGYLVYAQGDAARAAAVHAAALGANSDALDTAIDGTQRYRDSLKHQIEVQLAAARAALTESEAQVEAAQQKVAAFQLLSSIPIFSGIGLVGEAGFGNLTGSLAKTAQENEKYVTQIQDQLNALNKIMLTPAGDDLDGQGGKGKKTKDDAYQKKLKSVIDQTEAIIAQTDAQRGLNPLINDYGYAVEFAKQKVDLLQAAHEAGLKITPELKQQIDFLADGYARAGVEAKKLGEAQDETRAKAEQFFSGLKDITKSWIDDLIQGKTAAEALGDALSNVGDRLIGLGLDALFGTGQGSNSFGAIGKLFGLKEGGIVAHGKPLPAFANGGVSNTAAVFGEAGPEAAVPLPDGRRIPVDLRMPSGGNDGGVNAPIYISIDASGADRAAIERLHQSLGQLRAELPSRVVAAVRNAKSRGVKF